MKVFIDFARSGICIYKGLYRYDARFEKHLSKHFDEMERFANRISRPKSQLCASAREVQNVAIAGTFEHLFARKLSELLDDKSLLLFDGLGEHRCNAESNETR
jgi:hypothetical protein